MMRWQQQLYRPDDEGGGGAGDPPSPPPVVETPADPPKAAEGGETPETPKENPWYLQRINALTAQKKSAEERIAAAELRIKELEARPPGQGLSEEEVERRALTKAEKLAAEKAEVLASQKLFNAQLAEMGNSGRKEFGQSEFNGALQTFQASFGDLPAAFLEACVESGAGHRVIFELAKDLDKAASIMTLSSPVKLAAEVTKFAAELGSAKRKTPAAGGRTSSAPEPITPKVGGGGSGGDPLVKATSMKDWVREREAQLKAGRR